MSPLTVPKDHVVRPDPKDPRSGIPDLQAWSRLYDELNERFQALQQQIDALAAQNSDGQRVLLQGNIFRIVERPLRAVPDLVTEIRTGEESWVFRTRLAS